MTNTYKLAKTWQYLMIIPSVLLFLLFWSLYIFGGGSLDMPVGAWTLLLLVSAISGGMIYGAMTSKIVTSSLGIEHRTFGIQVWAMWDNVEKIEFTPDGFVNLHFKEPIYTNSFASALLFLYPYDKVIQLSPYLGDLSTNNLLNEIAKYVPQSDIPALVSKPKRSTESYKKASVIGIYYFSFFMAYFVFAILLQKRVEEYFIVSGWSNASLFFRLASGSLIYGLFINAMTLFRYNAEIEKLNKNEISHKARAHYLSPLTIVLLSVFVTIVLSQINLEARVLVVLLIGSVSPFISTGLERLIFQDNVQASQESA